MRLAFWLVVFVLSLTSSGAQDAPRLRVAPPEEVLTVVTELMENYPISATKGEFTALHDMLEAEMQALKAFPQIPLETALWAHNIGLNQTWFQDLNQSWHTEVAAAWLREAEPNFSAQTVWETPALRVEADAVDFNADGQPEWVLTLTLGGIDYWLVTADGQTLLEAPIPYTLSGRMLPRTVKSIAFQDLNGDGRVEWVLEQKTASWGFQTVVTRHVLAWQRDRLVEVGSIRAMTGWNDVTFVQEQNSQSDTTDIIAINRQRDNWGCLFEIRERYQWAPRERQFLTKQTEETIFDESPGCALTHAHRSLWAGRYAEAVSGYQTFIDSPITDPTDTDQRHTRLYAHLKLALALALLGESERANAVLNNAQLWLTTHDALVLPIMMYHAAVEVYQQDTPPVVLCAALYAVGIEYYHGRAYGTSNVFWGTIDWSNVPVNSGYRPVLDIGQATCDIFTVLEDYSPDTEVYQTVQDLLKTGYVETAIQNLMQRFEHGGFVGIFEVHQPAAQPTPDGMIYSSPNIRLMSPKDRLDMTRADFERFADDPRYGSVVRYHYAWALHDAGFDPDGAAAAYQAVIDHDPDSPWARLAALKVE